MRDYLMGLPFAARAVLLVVLVLFALINIVFLSSSIDGYRTERDRVERISPRMARLLGYIAKEPELVIAAGATKNSLADWSYLAEGEGDQVGAQLQQTLRSFAEDAALTVSGSQLARTAQATDVEGFDVMSVELSMFGGPEALDEFLSAVYAHKPVLVLDEMSVSKQRRRRSRADTSDDDTIVIRARVQALRVSEE